MVAERALTPTLRSVLVVVRDHTDRDTDYNFADTATMRSDLPYSSRHLGAFLTALERRGFVVTWYNRHGGRRAQITDEGRAALESAK